jgi:hypothetical protein
MLRSKFSAIFCQSSAKRLAFFSKNNVMIILIAKTSSSLSKKRQFFRQFILAQNIFKNRYIGP